IEMGDTSIRLKPPPVDAEAADEILGQVGAGDRRLIGLFLGAGHPSRRWPIENFAELAGRLSDDEQNKVLVFAGPEERDLRPGLKERFGDTATVVDELPLITFFAMLSRLRVFISGDTGPMHLAALAGAGIVLISQAGAPDIFLPLTERREVLNQRAIKDLSVDEVMAAVNRSF
ncbi:MAG TPA: glycosyltransferase family 9 protein, partial [Pyrinomonadaceae bacterium]|nr:glycosyltransferase family 9 protein [Pyrinomonadaceae bacterium]